ncbi:MAG: protein YgfX [Casimicrobiaceae bacterium]
MVALPPAVVVTLGPSRCAGVALGVLASGTAGIVLALPMPTACQTGLLLALLTWIIWQFLCIASRTSAGAVTELRVAADRLIAVRYGTRTLVAGHVRSASYIGARLTTIVWRPDGALWSRTVLILPDMLAEDDFRRLRVLLRHGRGDNAPRAAARVT